MSKIYHSNRQIKVSDLGRENTLPVFGLNIPGYKVILKDNLPKPVYQGAVKEGSFKAMPYMIQDQYNRAQKDSTLNTIVLENSKVKATFYPQFGGRIASLYDKVSKKELLFDNPVFQPANLALRNAWFSGGIEWNGPVYGHALLTCTPVYFAKVKVDGKEILRVYEYDRLLNTTWQVDLYLPEDSANIWYHVTARNLNNYEIPYYWWTNIAAPCHDKIRFITSSKESVNHFFEELINFPWPIENGVDISYPRRYKIALSLFYMDPTEKFPWFSYADEDGYGLFHLATPKLKGKKLWYFGYGQGGTNWMDTLSLPGKGQYIEIQAGITETQLQVVPVAANQKLSWTACFGPVSCQAEKAHHSDYQVAVKHTEEKLVENGLFKQLTEIDRQMTSWEDVTPDSVIHEGEAWGHLYEKMSVKKIPGLLFTAPITEKEQPWYELIVENTFSKDTLSKDPISWNVSDYWLKQLQNSVNAGKNTWLHNLHLGAVYLEKNDVTKAKEYFEKSIQLKNNFHSWRGLAVIAMAAGNFELSIELYLKAWKASNGSHDLYIEITKYLVEKNKVATLKEFAKECPTALANHEHISLAKALVALDENKFEEARKHLVREYIYVREGNFITTNIWFNSFFKPEEIKLGRTLTDTEKEKIKTKNPPPAIIDFQMKE